MGRDQDLNFGYGIKLEISHYTFQGNVEQTTGNLSLELSSQVQARERELRVISLQMIFKAMYLDELTKEMQKEKWSKNRA